MNNNWQPSASIATLKKRSDILRQIRNFFDKLGYFEVETPIMGRYLVTDFFFINFQ